MQTYRAGPGYFYFPCLPEEETGSQARSSPHSCVDPSSHLPSRPLSRSGLSAYLWGHPRVPDSESLLPLLLLLGSNSECRPWNPSLQARFSWEESGTCVNCSKPGTGGGLCLRKPLKPLLPKRCWGWNKRRKGQAWGGRASGKVAGSGEVTH